MVSKRKPETIFICEKCDKRFSTAQELGGHYTKHDPKRRGFKEGSVNHKISNLLARVSILALVGGFSYGFAVADNPDPYSIEGAVTMLVMVGSIVAWGFAYVKTFNMLRSRK